MIFNAVIGGSPTIEALTVTENGTYTAPSGVDGYSPVIVTTEEHPLPFTYSGSYTDERDEKGRGTVTFNTSGILEILKGSASAKAYILAGGGGAIKRYNQVGATGGGGGNQTIDVDLAPGTYQFVIGAGGIARDITTGYAGNGGNTTAFGITCTGGKGGYTTESSGTGGAGGTPNGSGGSEHDNRISTSGGAPNGGSIANYAPQKGGDGLVRLTFDSGAL